MAKGQNNEQGAQKNGGEEGQMFFTGRMFSDLEPDHSHVRLTFVDPDGRETTANVERCSELLSLASLYSMLTGTDMNLLSFTYNGTIIRPGQRVEDFGMKDGDIVTVAIGEGGLGSLLTPFPSAGDTFTF